MGMGVFQQKEPQKMPGAHKIGAAISGPRITGGNFMDTTLFQRKGGFDAEGSMEACLWFGSPSHKGSIEPFWGPKGGSIELFRVR